LALEYILLIGSLLLLISIVASKTTGKLGVPSLLIFLAIGMLAGSDGIGKIYFDNYTLAQSLGVIALTFILFTGGLETKFESVKAILWRGVMLSTVGVLITTVVLGIFISYAFHFHLIEGLLLAAIVSSTDASAVFTILRSKNIGLKGNLRPTLELESGSNDPMAFFLTIGLTSLLTSPDASFLSLVPMFFQQMIIGGLVGVVMGFAMTWLINNINLDYDGLYSVLTLALVLIVFSITASLGGNGFLAVYISAIIMGNRNFIHKKSLIKFYDGISWIMQITMFLVLGLLVYPKQMIPFISIGLLTALVLIFIARPVAVFLSLIFFKIRAREKLLISWVGLRGAVPIVFAIYPVIAGVEKSEIIFNIVFFIVITSVLIQGTTIPIVAKLLKVYSPVKEKSRYPLEVEVFQNFRNELFEIEIPDNSNAAGKPLVELKFPRSALVVLIKRADQFITPNGTTVVEKGDRLLVMTDNKKEIEKLKQLWMIKIISDA
jgi:cell volume regulation protein A